MCINSPLLLSPFCRKCFLRFCGILPGVPKKRPLKSKTRNVFHRELTLENDRDGIVREHREHNRGRNLADCGRICGSVR